MKDRRPRAVSRINWKQGSRAEQQSPAAPKTRAGPSVVDYPDRDSGGSGPGHHVPGAPAQTRVVVEGHHEVGATLPEHLLVPDWTRCATMAVPVGGENSHWEPKIPRRETGHEISSTCSPMDDLHGGKLPQGHLHEWKILPITGTTDQHSKTLSRHSSLDSEGENAVKAIAHPRGPPSRFRTQLLSEGSYMQSRIHFIGRLSPESGPKVRVSGSDPVRPDPKGESNVRHRGYPHAVKAAGGSAST